MQPSTMIPSRAIRPTPQQCIQVEGGRNRGDWYHESWFWFSSHVFDFEGFSDNPFIKHSYNQNRRLDAIYFFIIFSSQGSFTLVVEGTLGSVPSSGQSMQLLLGCNWDMHLTDLVKIFKLYWGHVELNLMHTMVSWYFFRHLFESWSSFGSNNYCNLPNIEHVFVGWVPQPYIFSMSGTEKPIGFGRGFAAVRPFQRHTSVLRFNRSGNLSGPLPQPVSGPLPQPAGSRQNSLPFASQVGGRAWRVVFGH